MPSSSGDMWRSSERRCARWLLMSHDRVGRDSFNLTQEFLSQMLGVRRPGVTEAAASLARNGLITYKRGRIRILDPAGLKDAACARAASRRKGHRL